MDSAPVAIILSLPYKLGTSNVNITISTEASYYLKERTLYLRASV